MPYMPRMTKKYDAVALYSGGLDSILAIKLIEKQGIKVKALHFVTPFFGEDEGSELLDFWRETHDLDILPVDISESYVSMMMEGPAYGFGKVLNPCVDCKIHMLGHARRLMKELGAKFIISGEVVGQRPMSQRRDTLNCISRDARVREYLLRPLSAKNLTPTPVEESGLVDREQLMNLGGRGRKGQLELAAEYGLKHIPTPAGGCRLADRENAKRFWPVMRRYPAPGAGEFRLANIGRQYWNGLHWFAIGRNEEDNVQLEALARPGDLIFDITDYPGPLSLARQIPGAPWTPETVKEAAALAASFSGKARRSGGEVEVSVKSGDEMHCVTVLPQRTLPEWKEITWKDVQEGKKEI